LCILLCVCVCVPHRHAPCALDEHSSFPCHWCCLRFPAASGGHRPPRRVACGAVVRSLRHARPASHGDEGGSALRESRTSTQHPCADVVLTNHQHPRVGVMDMCTTVSFNQLSAYCVCVDVAGRVGADSINLGALHSTSWSPAGTGGSRLCCVGFLLTRPLECVDCHVAALVSPFPSPPVPFPRFSLSVPSPLRVRCVPKSFYVGDDCDDD
jgi:hypothetical protein